MKRIHLIFTGLTSVIILLSLNRLTPWTSGYLQPYEFLRFLDFNAMIPIPLLTVLLYYLILREVTRDHPFTKTKLYMWLFLAFITGVYLFGASSGTHEVTNYLNTRFCDRGRVTTQLCQIIAYNDDEFSHYVYYSGLVLMNVVLLLTQYHIAFKTPMKSRDVAGITANALFIALGIFANLAFEEIGIDLWVFTFLAILSLYLWYSRRKLIKSYPIILYSGIAYTVGVVSTSLYKLFISP